MSTPKVPDFLLLMYPLTHDQRLEACRQFNAWQWPTALEAVKPKGFDSMPHYGKGRDDAGTKCGLPQHKALRDALYIVTNEWQRSWHHNSKPSSFHENGMSPEEHRQWWLNNYRQ